MGNIIAIIFLAVIVGYACHYIYKNKKNGNKCIGCSSAGGCIGCGDGCTCCCDDRSKGENQ